MGYTKDFIKGLGWIGFFRFGVKAIIFVKVIIAYRYLSPREVGLFGLAALALGLLEMLTETGINIVLIRDTKKLTYYLDTAFIISIVRGILISVVLVISAFLLPSFFRDDGLFPLLILVALIPVIKGFINPAEAKFVKDLEFHKEAIFRIGLACVDAFSAILLVRFMPTAASLVLGMLLGALAEVAISFLWIRPWPKLRFDPRVYQEIIHPGKWLNVVGIVSFAQQNFDNVIVGRVLGASSLGYYQTAFNLTRSSIGEVGTAFSQVLLPIYGRIVGDERRIKTAVVKIFIPAALIMLIPVILLNYGPVQEILLGLLKEKWRPMLVLLPYLSLTAWLTGMDTLVNPLFIAKDRIKDLVLLYAIGFLFMIVSVILFTQTYGLSGAALAVLLSRILLQPLFIWRTLTIARVKG